MQQLKIICDACEKECQPQEGSGTFGGVITRINTKLEKVPYKFVQDFCPECVEVILNFISELKKDVAERTNRQAEHGSEGDTGKK